MSPLSPSPLHCLSPSKDRTSVPGSGLLAVLYNMVSSTRSLSAGSLMLALLASPVSAGSYSLVETWQGKNFLDYFNFHVGSDPTNGYVNYLDKDHAENTGLYKVTDTGSVYLGVDHVTKLDPNGKGRDSVRVGTKKFYDKSLVIADIAHMPGSACGTWPAFWSVGKEWPSDGEIDIIEGVNLQDHNEIVMHTAGTCSLTDTAMTGIVNATGCGEDLGTVGCVIEGHKGSYGTSFNQQGGGVYALEWTEEHLKIWHFPRRLIPESIKRGNPDVTQFGTPMALVKESCDVANSFKPQSFTFDVTFCGDWAGGIFGDSGCPATDADSFKSCHNYVANHPMAFKDSYWEINSVKVYQTDAKGIMSSSTSTTQSSQTAAVVESKTQQDQHKPTKPSSPAISTPTASVPTFSETAAEIQSTNTGSAVQPPASQHGVPVGNVSNLNLASGSAPTATEGYHVTQEAELPPTKKTRTITSHLTATRTICPEEEKSTHTIVQSYSHDSVPPFTHPRAPTSISQTTPAPPTITVTSPVHPGAYTWSAQAEPTSATSPGLPSLAPAPPASHAAQLDPSTPMEHFGYSWIQPSMPPSASVASVPYDASRALIPAPTDVSPVTASSATSRVFAPSHSHSGISPVFRGAATRLSISLSSVACALILALLA